MDAAVAALAELTSTSSPLPGSPDAPLADVLADIDVHLAVLYSTATKLALALKPTEPAYAAATPLIHDLVQRKHALAFCTSLLQPGRHGATLVKAVADPLADITTALRALAHAFLDNTRGPTSQDYLAKTGALHDLITRARALPKDNQTAVYRAWKSDRDALEDSLQEVAHMINDTPGEFGDGWDDLGLSSGARLDEHELARAKNVHHILRLTTLLHKRILLDLLAFPSSAPVLAFDTLLVQSNRLVSKSDDLVAALYAPQVPDDIRKEIVELSTTATSLHTHTAVLLPDQLAAQLQTLRIDGTNAPPSKRADKKWFDTCVDQIVRLCARRTVPPGNAT